MTGEWQSRGTAVLLLPQRGQSSLVPGGESPSLRKKWSQRPEILLGEDLLCTGLAGPPPAQDGPLPGHPKGEKERVGISHCFHSAGRGVGQCRELAEAKLVTALRPTVPFPERRPVTVHICT